jgi:hypothetical protein
MADDPETEPEKQTDPQHTEQPTKPENHHQTDLSGYPPNDRWMVQEFGADG